MHATETAFSKQAALPIEIHTDKESRHIHLGFADQIENVGNHQSQHHNDQSQTGRSTASYFEDHPLNSTRASPMTSASSLQPIASLTTMNSRASNGDLSAASGGPPAVDLLTNPSTLHGDSGYEDSGPGVTYAPEGSDSVCESRL